MFKRLILSVAIIASCCLAPSGQSQVPTATRFDGSAFSSPLAHLPPLTLADDSRFSFMTALSWQRPVEYLPPFNPSAPQDFARSSQISRDSREQVSYQNVELRPIDKFYVGGEIGFLYGKSTGKYGYEYQQGYVIGEIGNEWFQLTVGTSYERTTGHLYRLSR